MNRKSKSERKIFGKNRKVSYRKRTPKKRPCKLCGRSLIGIKGLNSFKLNKTNKSFKVVNRKYGGELCSACSRREIINGVRK